jgi:glyoxylase-like metal-dependent hydrolase (beta-lactamase superfamily II)
MAAKSVRKVVDGLYHIAACEEFIPDSNIYLVQNKDHFTLFDAGIQVYFKETAAAIQELGFNLTQMDQLILTHTHLDHSGSCPPLLETAKKAELWVSREEGELLEQGDDSLVLGSMLGQRLPPLRVDRKLQEGDAVRVGDFSFQVLHTPGHSFGSLCFFEPRKGILIAGDVVFRGGSFGRVDFPTGNGQQLIASIARLAKLPVKILLPGHMGITTKGAQEEIKLSLQFAQQML